MAATPFFRNDHSRLRCEKLCGAILRHNFLPTNDAGTDASLTPFRICLRPSLCFYDPSNSNVDRPVITDPTFFLNFLPFFGAAILPPPSGTCHRLGCRTRDVPRFADLFASRLVGFLRARIGFSSHFLFRFFFSGQHPKCPHVGPPFCGPPSRSNQVVNGNRHIATAFDTCEPITTRKQVRPSPFSLSLSLSSLPLFNEIRLAATCRRPPPIIGQRGPSASSQFVILLFIYRLHFFNPPTPHSSIACCCCCCCYIRLIPTAIGLMIAFTVVPKKEFVGNDSFGLPTIFKYQYSYL